MAEQNTLGAGERQSLIEQAEKLQTRLMQLHAALVVTYGATGEVFRDLSDCIQDNYMWGLVEKCEQLAEAASSLSSSLVKLEVSHG